MNEEKIWCDTCGKKLGYETAKNHYRTGHGVFFNPRQLVDVMVESGKFYLIMKGAGYNDEVISEMILRLEK